MLLFAYIHSSTSYGADYHYTTNDLIMAALIITPVVVLIISLLFAVPIQDSIASWWEKR
jgi:hypothetical protein